MKPFGKLFDLVFVFLAVTLIPLGSTYIAGIFYSYIKFMDPNGTYLFVSVHHIIQFFLTIILMKLYVGTMLSDWGFNLKERKVSLKIFAWFSLVWFVYEFFVGVLPYLLDGTTRLVGYPLNLINIIGVLIFQGLLSGTCEEPLFRGYTMTLLGKSWTGVIRIWKLEFTTAGLFATLFFVYAHIGISINPFQLRFSYGQLFVSFVLGIYYAGVFNKTKSLLAPILSHNIANVFVMLARYVTVWM